MGVREETPGGSSFKAIAPRAGLQQTRYHREMTLLSPYCFALALWL